MVLVIIALVIGLLYNVAGAPQNDLHTLYSNEENLGEHLHHLFGDLLNQLEKTAFSMPDFRIKRHSSNKKECNFVGDKLCCDFPNLSKKRDVRDCHRQFILAPNITKSSSLKQNQNASECFMECVAKKNGWIDANGFADKEAVNTSLQAGDLTQEWRQLQEEAVIKCFQDLATIVSSADSVKNITCKSGSQQLMYCIFEHTFLNCPKDSWHETEKCRAALSLVTAMSERRHSRTVFAATETVPAISGTSSVASPNTDAPAETLQDS